MGVKRYLVWSGALHGKPNSVADNTKVVLATSYDALLAVLRRCVTALTESRESILAEWSSEEAWPDEEGIDAALAAARAVLEEEAKP